MMRNYRKSSFYALVGRVVVLARLSWKFNSSCRSLHFRIVYKFANISSNDSYFKI